MILEAGYKRFRLLERFAARQGGLGCESIQQSILTVTIPRVSRCKGELGSFSNHPIQRDGTMLLKAKVLMMVAAVGYGVLFSLALTAGVRIACLLLGTTLSTSAAGNLFLVSSLLAGGVSAYAYDRQARRAGPQATPVSLLDQHFLV
jgi:hypothetical protein